MNKGMLHSRDANISRTQYDRYGNYVGEKDTGVADLKARKEWAYSTAGQHNATWVSKQSNASEQSDATIEQGDATIEQGGESNE